MSNTFFHLHAHSEYSVLDGMPTVKDMVDKVERLGHPALALTDHGNMSGAVQLYKETTARDMKPFIGEEFYFVHDINDPDAERYHMLIHALTLDGYKQLVWLSSLSHQRPNFHKRPRIDWKALEHLDGSDLMATSGCFFGLVCQLIQDDRYSEAKKVVKRLKRTFPHFYIEVQMHDNDEDEWLLGELWTLAQETSTPVVVTNDAHYCDKHDQSTHDFMKSIAYHGTDAGDYQFPGSAYHLSSGKAIKKKLKLYPHIWEAACESFDEVLDLNELRIPNLDKYQYFVPSMADEPVDKLRRLCKRGLKKMGLSGRKEYTDRVKHELGVIEKLSMADYFLLTLEIIDFCHQEQIFVEARGSANGSLVCYLTGISQADPVEYECLFERFLSLDRTKPPDIDLDIEDTGRVRVIEFMAKRFGTVNIGTYNKMGINDEGTGSVLVQFFGAERRRLGEDFKNLWGGVKTIGEIKELNPTVARHLNDLHNMTVRRGAGAHAGGFVLETGDNPIGEFLPTMLIASSETTVTQYTMDDVEDMGFLKMDCLGQSSLRVIRRTFEMLGHDVRDGMAWIPLDDRPVYGQLRKGRTNTGIFQFEGYTAAKGCKEMGVKNIEDLIVVNALYRPATMNSGWKDIFIRNRKYGTPGYPSDIHEEVTKKTYGVIVYQEQVMTFLRLLGFPNDRLNAMLKALKASNDKIDKAARTIEDAYADFMDLASDAGMEANLADETWAGLEEFSNYSFNRGHSVAYALRGYRTAWLKVNHPIEFHTALLEVWASTKKERLIEIEARKCKVELLPPDINESEANWILSRSGGARRGFLSIKGIGKEAANELINQRPLDGYRNLSSIAERCEAKKVSGFKNASDGILTGVGKSLQEAGALVSIGVDRY
jgi:DNA polymerase-3 subunit alpha